MISGQWEGFIYMAWVMPLPGPPLLVCIGTGAEFSQGLILVAWSYNRHDSFHCSQNVWFRMLFGFLACHVVHESHIEKATNAAAQNNECDEKTLKASLFGELLFKSPLRIQCCKGSIFNWKWSHQRTVSRVNLPRSQISQDCTVKCTFWARIFKRLWSPGIDSKEWVPSAYVAFRAGTITLFLLGS